METLSIGLIAGIIFGLIVDFIVDAVYWLFAGTLPPLFDTTTFTTTFMFRLNVILMLVCIILAFTVPQ